MWFGVLGTLEIRADGGRAVPVGGPVRRALLAALLCRAGQVVPADELIEHLWAVPPRSAAKTLQSHVVRLRDDLGRERALITTGRTGYALQVPAADLDAGAFELALRDGLDALGRHDGIGAVERLDAALAWWRGVAYGEFGDAPFAVTERMRLTELRALALESRTDAALELGQAAVLVGELEQRTAHEPYRERSWEQLITALYRSGRQADALATYRTARDLLVNDLGVDPGPALRSVHDRVLSHDPGLLLTADARPRPPVPSPHAGRCPWRGLDGYGEGDTDLFVGREAVCAKVLSRLAEPGALVLSGASGSGKSSLVRAALVPSLRAGALPGSAAWPVNVITPTTGWPGDTGAVIFVDQAEELFAVLTDAERDSFVAAVAAYVDDGGRVVLVLRGDFFGHLADVPWLSGLGDRAPVLIGPMREEALRRVVVEPARRVGLDVEAEVVDAVIDDAADQPQPLPMISLALVRAWSQAPGATVTVSAYRNGGGVAGAIESTAEAVYLGLDEPGRIEARRLLVRMAAREGATWVRRPVRRTERGEQRRTGRGEQRRTGRGEQRRTERGEGRQPTPLGGDGPATPPDAAVDALIAGRLVTVTAGRWELSHDALLERWPRLRGWLEERASEAERLDHLAAAAQAWNGAGRPAGDLYRGLRLHAALEWRRQHPEDVTAQESAFLDASERADQSELALAQRRVATERRGRHRLRWVAAGLAATLVVALVGALLAITARSEATRSAHRARAEAVTADARRLAAESLSAPDIATSALLAAASYRLQDSPDARGAMLSALERGQSALFRVATPRRLVGLLASVDGTRLYALQNDRTVDVIDTARRRIVSSYPALATDVIGVVGRSLVVAGNAPSRTPSGFGRLTVRDAATGATVRVLSETSMDGPAVPSMAPGGRWLVADQATDSSAQHPTRVVAVYDARDWSRPARTIQLPAPVVEIAAGMRVAAVSTTDRHLYLVDLATMRILRSGRRPDLPDQATASENVPFGISPDGRQLAYVGEADASPPVLVRTNALSGAGTALPRTGSAPDRVQFDPGGTELAVGADDGTLGVYRVADGEPVATLAGESGAIMGVAWAAPADSVPGADTPALFTDGLDSQVVSWSVSATPRLVGLHGPPVPTADFTVQAGTNVYGVYPRQGSVPMTRERMFLLDLRDATMRSWPLGVGADDYITQVAGTADGARAIVSVEGPHSNRWQLWDLRRGVVLRTVSSPPGADNSLGLSAAISSDGATAIVAVNPTTLAVLDLRSGRFSRTIRVHFAGAAGARAHAVPWQFTPDGRVLLWGYDPGPPASAGGAGPDQQLGLLDVGRGALVAQTAVGDIDSPKFFGWSHDGATMVMGSYAGSLSTFTAATLRPIAKASTADTGYVLSASFSPDDRTIVAAGTDATMSFWTAATLSRQGGREVIPNANASWWYAWFTPAGEVRGLAPQVALPNVDAERLFTFPGRPSEWYALTCALAGQDMTRGQWTQYAGDQPYRHVC